jgi:hypothetical protein
MGTSLTGILGNTTGQTLVAKDFIKLQPGQCIPDEKMREIVDRLLLSIQPGSTSDVIVSDLAPQDKTKFWYNSKDNNFYFWSESEGVWIQTDVGNIIPKITEHQDLTVISDALGVANINIYLTRFRDAKAQLQLMPKQDLGKDARWWVTSQTDTLIQVAFADLAFSTTLFFNAHITRTSNSA